MPLGHPIILLKSNLFNMATVSVKWSILEKVFDEFLFRKKAILDDKNIDLLMVKEFKFSNELTHGFCQKLEIFKLAPFQENKARESVW